MSGCEPSPQPQPELPPLAEKLRLQSMRALHATQLTLWFIERPELIPLIDNLVMEANCRKKKAMIEYELANQEFNTELCRLRADVLEKECRDPGSDRAAFDHADQVHLQFWKELQQFKKDNQIE